MDHDVHKLRQMNLHHSVIDGVVQSRQVSIRDVGGCALSGLWDGLSESKQDSQNFLCEPLTRE